MSYSLSQKSINEVDKTLEITLKPRAIDDPFEIEESEGNQNHLRFLNQEKISSRSYSTDTITKDLKNYYNVQYYGTLYVGDKLTPITLIFDTGSSWLWMASKDCTDCELDANLYDYSSSPTYKQTTTIPQHIQYGRGSVWGYKAIENFCLSMGDSDKCLEKHNFISVFSASDLKDLKADGILGLAPTKSYTQDHTFLDSLYEAQIISRRMFSMSLGGDNEDSKIILGGYDLKYAKNNQRITWNEMLEDKTYWTVQLTSGKLGNYTFNLDTNRAFIDSGASYIFMPQDDFNEFKREIEKDRKCTYDYGKTNMWLCYCVTDTYSDFPDFEIKLGNNIYRIPSTSYMVRQNFKCYFKVQPQFFTGYEYWILGQAFMRNYFTIFDLENDRIGLIGSVHVDSVSYFNDIVLTLSVLLAVIGFGAFAVSLYRERKQKQQSHNEVRKPQIQESELINVGRYKAVNLQSPQTPEVTIDQPQEVYKQ